MPVSFERHDRLLICRGTGNPDVSARFAGLDRIRAEVARGVTEVFVDLSGYGADFDPSLSAPLRDRLAEVGGELRAAKFVFLLSPHCMTSSMLSLVLQEVGCTSVDTLDRAEAEAWLDTRLSQTPASAFAVS